MLKKLFVFALGIFICGSLFANEVSIVRFSQFKKNEIKKGESVIIEFREGDRLPVTLRSEGDLFQSVDSTPTFIEVKKLFFIKISENEMLMSFDGHTFKGIKDSLNGSFSIGTKPDGSEIQNFPVTEINLVFSAFIKQ